MKKKTTTINLNVINEGMFSHFVSAIVGFILGKKSLNTVIKGKEEDIKKLEKYLIQAKMSSKEKDALVSKLISMKSSSSSIEKLKRDFFDSTGIRIP